jgi:hypothetical protein
MLDVLMICCVGGMQEFHSKHCLFLPCRQICLICFQLRFLFALKSLQKYCNFIISV